MLRTSLLVFSERDEFCARITSGLHATTHAQVCAVVTLRERLAEAVSERRPDLILADIAPAP